MPNPAAITVDLAQARAFWWLRQGLGVRRAPSVEAAVAGSGWLYSAGGSGPYLALRARADGVTRAAVERAAAERRLVETWGVRGCAMLVPPTQTAVALAAARRSFGPREKKLFATGETNAADVKAASSKIINLLKRGPRAADGVRDALPAAKPFGTAAKKLGESSIASVALRTLVLDGRVERVPDGGRLDDPEYQYQLRGDALDVPRDGLDELLKLYLHWAGPATLADAAAWCETTQTEVKRRAAALGCVSVEVRGIAAPMILLESDADALRAAPPPAGAHALPFRDHLLSMRRGIAPWLPAGAPSPVVLDWENRPVALAEVESLHHHALVEGGELVGLWEVEPKSGRVVWAPIGKLAAARRARVESAVDALQQFVARELGGVVRYYAFDSEKKREGRAKAVAAAAKRA